jgi:hypothetical protein
MTYILPVLLYGLEIFIPTDAEATVFYENTLRQMLSLPTNVAKPALYVLLGAVPLEAYIHRKALGMFGSIARSKTSIEHQVAQRQILMYTYRDGSWFSRIKVTLLKYDLPSASSVLDSAPSKEVWKKTVQKNVERYWMDNITQAARLYPSLHALNTEMYKPECCHPIVKSVTSLPADSRRVGAHLRLVTGTCILQSKKARYNQYAVDPTCLLCKNGPETSVHFLMECKALDEPRSRALMRIGQTVDGISELETSVSTQLILDPTHPDVAEIVPRENINQLLRGGRILVNCLWLDRARQLIQKPSRKRDGL